MSKITMDDINNHLNLLIRERNAYGALEITNLIDGTNGRNYVGRVGAFVRCIDDLLSIQDTERHPETILIKFLEKSKANCESSKKLYLEASSAGEDLEVLRNTCISNLAVLGVIMRDSQFRVTESVPQDFRKEIKKVLDDNTYMHNF